MKYLVDTNVLSEAQRTKGHPAVRAMLESIPEQDLYISVITLGEIRRGIAKLPGGKRREELQAWFSLAEMHFRDRILPIGPDIALRWGELTARLETSGKTLHVADGLIAATALHHGLALLTRNGTDFVETGVTVVNPLEST